MRFFRSTIDPSNNSPQDRGPDLSTEAAEYAAFDEYVTAPKQTIFNGIKSLLFKNDVEELMPQQIPDVLSQGHIKYQDFDDAYKVFGKKEDIPDGFVAFPDGFIARLGTSINTQLTSAGLDTSAQLLEITSQITLFFGSLVTCETLPQYIAATGQFIGSIAGAKISQMLMKRSSPTEVQGPAAALEQILSYIRNTKTVSSSFYDSPTYLFFKDTMGIAALCGLCTKISAGELELISARFVKDAATTVKGDVFGTIMRSFEFAFEVARDVASGCNLSHFVLGKGVMSVASDLLSRKDDFIRGMLMQRHGIADSHYLSMLKKVLIDLDEFIRRKHGAEEALAINMKQRIQALISDVQAKITTSGFRPKPFCIMLYGASGVGKSTLLPKIVQHFGAITGVPTAPENQVVINEDEKYDPVTGKTTVVILDDMCNTKGPAAEQKPPTANLIKYNNCVPTMAVKADVIEKGCIPIQPDLLMITTNVAHLNAFQHSNEPMSIYNRIDIALRVTPKKYCSGPNGRLDYTKIRDKESPINVAEITYKVTRDKKVTVSYGLPVCWDEYADTMIDKAMAHRKRQAQCVEDFNSQNNDSYCRACYRNLKRCECEEGDQIICRPIVHNQGLISATRRIYKRFNPGTNNTEAGMALVRLLTMTSTITRETPVFTLFFTNRCTRAFTELFWAVLDYNEFTLLSLIILTLISSAYLPFVVFVLYIVFITYLAYSVVYNTHIVATRLVTTRLIRSFQDRMPELATELLDYIFFVPAIAVGLVLMRRLMTGMQFLNQGNLRPTTMEDVEKRITEPTEWAQRDSIRAEFVVSQKSKTTTALDMGDKVAQYTYTITGPAKQAGKQVRCTALRVCGDYVVLPKHSYELIDTSQGFKFVQHSKRANGVYDRVFLNPSTCHQVKEDHVCLRATGIPRNGDIRDLFPETVTYGDVEATIILPDNRPRPVLLACYKERITTTATEISGFCGTTLGETLNGDCCSAWVSRGRVNAIIGLHNGRSHNLVISEFIPRSAFDFINADLVVTVQGVTLHHKMPPPLMSIDTSCGGKMFDEDIYTSVEPDPRSCVNFATMHPDGRAPIVEVYGAVDGTRATAFSTITATKLSPHLAAAGYPRKHGKPAFNANRNFAATYQKAQFPMRAILPEALSWAIADYVQPLVEKIHSIKYYYSPLTMFEALNGRRVYGQHINAMNMATSPGIGLSGTKKDHMDVINDDKQGNIYTAKPYVAAEVQRIEAILGSGSRCAPISKGALKDEPTPIGKEKVRVFFVMPMAFLIVGRQILAPILCFLLAFPLLSEQWFGMRTTTDEWQQAYDHLNTFGGREIMNGDYSAYDQTISSQIIEAVGVIFYAIGEAMGYTPYWLGVMHSWFADIANPVYAFNGTLLSFFGYMPSGNPGTVAVNGIGNSLFQRSFFYTEWVLQYKTPPPVGIFQQYCKFGFVGDDSIGGVSADIPWFNMPNFRDWCFAHGIKYTMPDKGEDMVHHFDLEHASLCKRTFNVVTVEEDIHPTGRIVLAPIEIESILKSWHNLHKPQEDEWLIMRNNITQGLREVARHPQDVFDPIVQALRQALAACPEAPHIPEVFRTYNEWQLDIYARYNSSPESAVRTLEEDINDYLQRMWED